MSEIYVVTSGKGGVGKTTTTANLGMGLAMRGKKVVLVDTDTGLRNLDLLLGLENRIMYDLIDVTEGRVAYKKALVRHKKYDNLFLLPTSQVKDKMAVNPEQLVKLCEKELNWKRPTTYTVLRKLCEKGIFQNAEGIVSSRISRADFLAMRGERFVAETYGGSLPAFVAAFTARNRLTEEEADAIQKLIDAARREG